MKKKLLSMFIAASMSYTAAFANAEYLNPNYKVKVLNSINSSKDVKKLSKSQLNDLADDLRYGILNRANTVGGQI